MVGGTKALGVVADILDAAMRHVADVVNQRTVLRLDVKQTVLETLIGEVRVALRIHDADAVDFEVIGIHVRGGRT